MTITIHAEDAAFSIAEDELSGINLETLKTKSFYQDFLIKKLQKLSKLFDSTINNLNEGYNFVTFKSVSKDIEFYSKMLSHSYTGAGEHVFIPEEFIGLDLQNGFNVYTSIERFRESVCRLLYNRYCFNSEIMKTINQINTLRYNKIKKEDVETLLDLYKTENHCIQLDIKEEFTDEKEEMYTDLLSVLRDSEYKFMKDSENYDKFNKAFSFKSLRKIYRVNYNIEEEYATLISLDNEDTQYHFIYESGRRTFGTLRIKTGEEYHSYSVSSIGDVVTMLVEFAMNKDFKLELPKYKVTDTSLNLNQHGLEFRT